MKNTKPFLYIVSFVVLFSIGSILFFQNKSTNDEESHATDERMVTPMADPTNLKNNEKNILQVNSIAMGETIKNHLRHDPSVYLIKHDNNTESHYLENEVTVKFKTEPTQQTLNRVAKEINGKMLKKLNSTLIFQSDTLSTSELIGFFNKQENVEFVEA